MKIYKAIALLIASMLLSGCAGLFVAGAATTVNIVTDTRSAKEIWNDSALESEVLVWATKPLTSAMFALLPAHSVYRRTDGTSEYGSAS